MNKKQYRYFFGFLEKQEHWLNKMAAGGYKLIRTEKMLYEFEKCRPHEMQYCVEFIGEKSKDNACDYHDFLEDLGYTVFYKNMNINYSIGKVRCRPWAEKGGRVATNATTFNREILIVGKENDGKIFELHTTFADRIRYYQTLRNPWLFLFIFFALCGSLTCSVLFGAISVISLISVIFYQKAIMQNKNLSTMREE